MQLTNAIIDGLPFILGSAVLLAIAVGFYFWDERKRGLGNEQGKLRAALRKARRAGPSDQSGDAGGSLGHPVFASKSHGSTPLTTNPLSGESNSTQDESGDDGGHPIRSEPFWRER